MANKASKFRTAFNIALIIKICFFVGIGIGKLIEII